MAFRALTRCRALTSGTARRAPSRPIGSGTSSSRAKFFRSAHTGPQSKKSGKLIPLQLLVLGAIPLFAGYLIGRSGTSGPAAEGQAKLSHVNFASRKEMVKAAREISNALGEGVVSFDEDEIEVHGHSDWSTSNSSGRPVAIVYPKTTEDVSQIAKVCNKYNVPMVPFGAGSSVEGSFSSPYSGICIDFVHMDKIVAFHPDEYSLSSFYHEDHQS
ncbi:glycolate oxidase [Colletotrichum nymphaeae SA-01]|uniref:Glycolate oxidase n=1 Tax=Colletotrichum nymphaeae SA-01 TaxID=1460502 RepID=A0A135SXZ8_9PEZI|nr:glycolate oxidase [Colletotrichum nymphaeae SA-01]